MSTANATLTSSYKNLIMRVSVKIENGIYSQISYKEDGTISSESEATLFRTLPNGDEVFTYKNSGNENENLNSHTGFALVSGKTIKYFNINRDSSGIIKLD